MCIVETVFWRGTEPMSFKNRQYPDLWSLSISSCRIAAERVRYFIMERKICHAEGILDFHCPAMKLRNCLTV